VWSRTRDEKDTYIASWIRDAVSGLEKMGDADHGLEFPVVMWWLLQTNFRFLSGRGFASLLHLFVDASSFKSWSRVVDLV
jgi:hypothetical protein